MNARTLGAGVGLLVTVVVSSCVGNRGVGDSGQSVELGASEDCTLTQGYWKNHSDAWPVDSLTIGGTTYSKDELLAILWTPTTGDASLILGHQLIAALLNGAAGASVPPEVETALADADAWMAANKDADGKLPYGTPKTGAAHDEAVALSATLDSYNQGTIGPGHCGDGSTSGSGGSGGGTDVTGTGGFTIPTGSGETTGSGGVTTTGVGGASSCDVPCGADLPPCPTSQLCIDNCCAVTPQ
jgi:hypothetical protein